MKTIFYFLLSLSCILAQLQSSSQSIWKNDITGTNPNTANPFTDGDVAAAYVTVSGIGRGLGIAGTNANNRYNANSWNTAALDPDAYFSFTLTPLIGHEIDFGKFNFTVQRSGSGPTNVVLRSSIDGYTDDIAAFTITLSSNDTAISIDLSAPGFQNINSAITFRLYAYGATASSGTFSVNDFEFTEFTSLPVTFGNLQATRHDGAARIVWSTLKETNNSHFNVEVSDDGKVFKKIATVQSKAANGMSDTPLDYEVSVFTDRLTGFALPAFLALLTVSFARRRLIRFFAVSFIAAIIISSCVKPDLQSLDTIKDNLLVRIAQVDIDGKTSYSKVVTLVAE